MTRAVYLIVLGALSIMILPIFLKLWNEFAPLYLPGWLATIVPYAVVSWVVVVAFLLAKGENRDRGV